jgi:hypothetical protein
MYMHRYIQDFFLYPSTAVLLITRGPRKCRLELLSLRARPEVPRHPEHHVTVTIFANFCELFDPSPAPCHRPHEAPPKKAMIEEKALINIHTYDTYLGYQCII